MLHCEPSGRYKPLNCNCNTTVKCRVTNAYKSFAVPFASVSTQPAS